jgi:hypothetical protein
MNLLLLASATLMSSFLQVEPPVAEVAERTYLGDSELSFMAHEPMVLVEDAPLDHNELVRLREYAMPAGHGMVVLGQVVTASGHGEQNAACVDGAQDAFSAHYAELGRELSRQEFQWGENHGVAVHYRSERNEDFYLMLLRGEDECVALSVSFDANDQVERDHAYAVIDSVQYGETNLASLLARR